MPEAQEVGRASSQYTSLRVHELTKHLRTLRNLARPHSWSGSGAATALHSDSMWIAGHLAASSARRMG
eukprot:365130-Chlamydomonas_euryale.AAC.35